MPRLSPARGRRRSAEPAWADLPEPELLQVPLRRLKVTLDGWVGECFEELNNELHEHGLKLRAHGWISDEWFSPPETPGIAVPFYLTHPRLMRLERKMMHEVEGGTPRECLRYLRHEAGHVVQHAFDLHRRKRWRNLFGPGTLPYPDHYRANPASKHHVQHLRRWYAQCHPDEDFAETFAVWLSPRSNWRKRYAGWPALEKLEYVDELMADLAGAKPPPLKRVQIDPLSQLKGTLGEHYQKKRERYALDTPTVFDGELKRLFSDQPRHRRAPLAATVIKDNRARIVRAVARWSGEYPLALDAALDDMINRCRVLNLRAPQSALKVRQDLTAMLTSKAVHAHYSSSRRRRYAV